MSRAKSQESKTSTRDSQVGKGESKGEKQPVVTNSKTTAADPNEFDKNTTPRRERMAKDIKEMPPEERLKQGR